MATPQKIKLPKHLAAVEDLLLWRDPLRSGAALFGVTALYIILELSGTPLLTWLAYSSAFAVFVTLVWATAAGFVGIAGPSEYFPPLLKSGLDEAAVQQLATRACTAANATIALKCRLLSGNEPGLSIQGIVVLFAIGILGRLASPVLLVFIAIVAAFTLPKLYELRKDEVDQVAGVALQQVEAQYKVARRQVEANLQVATAKVNKVVERFTPKKAGRPAESSEAKAE